MPMQAVIFDRDRERKELDRAWGSGRPELLIAAGRRRAGKSYLLTRYLQERRGFYYQATNVTSRDQLRSLSAAAATQFPQVGLDLADGFRDWETFFNFIVRMAEGGPFLLVLDEVPYLMEAVRGFGTLLQRFWDHNLPGTQVKLVLSGSYVSAMRRLTTADQPLHGRKTGTLAFSPFSYLDAAKFVPGYSARDRLVAYATFGGLPGQLALLDPAAGIAENVAAHMLNPGGRLAEEGARLFDAFLKDAGVHYSIVRAVAAGEQKWSKITSRVGKGSASLSRPLEWLRGMDIIDRVIPATEPPPGNPKKAMYRITDPYLAFWHRFVAPIRATGADDLREPGDLWQDFVAPYLDEYMGPVFESVCRTFVGRGQHARMPFQPVRGGEWWSDDSTEQVDVVALGRDGEVLLGECKWGTVDRKDVAALEHRRDLLVGELKGVTRVHLAVFAGNPIGDRTLVGRIERGDLLHFTLDDLFVERGPGRPA
ncbi:MAG: ATP-binding protein [Gemmatimonadaceae bacterium]